MCICVLLPGVVVVVSVVRIVVVEEAVGVVVVPVVVSVVVDVLVGVVVDVSVGVVVIVVVWLVIGVEVVGIEVVVEVADVVPKGMARFSCCSEPLVKSSQYCCP